MLDFTMRNSLSSSTHMAAAYPSSSSSATGSFSVNPSSSFARRRALKEADEGNQTRVVDSYPLLKYMAITQRLFSCFQQSFEHLNLNEAYVYGMRFAHLGLSTLPKHREWTAGGEAEDHLRSQIAKVLSRLEIIKRRMDEEETAKLQARMLTQAEEETRRQNQFHREQERRRTVLGDKGNKWNGKHDITLHWNDQQAKPQTIVAAEVEAMGEFASSNHSKINGSSYLDENSLSGSFTSTNAESGQRGDAKLRIKSTGEKATTKLRKLLGIPKSSKGASKTKTEASTATASMEIIAQSRRRGLLTISRLKLPSLNTIRQSRAQHELHGLVAKTTGPEPHPTTTHYTIEELSVVKEVTLKLYPMQTPTLSNLRYAPALDSSLQEVPYGTQEKSSAEIHRESNQEEMDRQVYLPLSLQIPDTSHLSSHPTSSIPANLTDIILLPKDMDEIVSTIAGKTIETKKEFTNDDAKPVKVDSNKLDLSFMASSDTADTKERILAGIAHHLISTRSDEGLMNRYALVLNELKKKLPSMYTGHHIIVQSKWENDDRSFDKGEYVDSNLYTKAISDPNIISDPEPVQVQDSFVNEGTNNEINLDTFDEFDAFLSKKVLINEEEESYTEFTVLEEEIDDRVSPEILEEESYLEFVIEEEMVDDETYLEYTVAEESVQSFQLKKRVEAANASELLVNSPTCVASDNITSAYKEPCSRRARQIPEFRSTIENLSEFPSIHMRPVLDEDEITYITMDPWLEDIDTTDQDPSEDFKQRIKTIIHKDLWKCDVAMVRGAMEELNEMVKNWTSSRALVAEYGGIMAIVRAMIGFPDHEGVQFLCCDTLGLLASEPENQMMIHNMDGVPLISQSMAGHPDSQRIQDAARAAIAAVYLG